MDIIQALNVALIKFLVIIPGKKLKKSVLNWLDFCSFLNS